MTDNWQPEIIGGWTVPEAERDALKAALDEAEQALQALLDIGHGDDSKLRQQSRATLARIREQKEKAGGPAEEFIQHQNPVTKTWVKLSRRTGRIVARAQDTPFDGVPVYEPPADG